MLIGNKCDMEEKRMISKERGEKVAEENGIKFYETSAKDNVNIEHAFITLAEDILNKQSPVDGQTSTDPIKLNGSSENPKSNNACCKI
jgi:Ras-related protein Rab-10